MVFREIRPTWDIENLLEPEDHTEQIREGTHSSKLLSFSKFSISFPNVPINIQTAIFLCVRIAIIAGLVWFGAATSGTFYGPISGKFTGVLATVFYTYQFGTLLEVVGLIVGYDTIKNIFK